MLKMDNQQGHTVQHRELYSMLCGSPDGRGVWGRMDTCICTAESLRCSPETISVLLIGYPPVQNKRLCLKKKMWYIHTVGYYSAIKNEAQNTIIDLATIITLCTWTLKSNLHQTGAVLEKYLPSASCRYLQLISGSCLDYIVRMQTDGAYKRPVLESI